MIDGDSTRISDMSAGVLFQPFKAMLDDDQAASLRIELS